MKKTHLIKEALLQVILITTVILIASCGNNQKPADTKYVANEQNEAKFNDNKQENDAKFIVSAAEISMEQIQLGKLAQQYGRTSHVKELGKMMEDAHTKSLNELTSLAKSKMITIPASPTDNAKEAYRKLEEKSGNDFDKAYADMMVNEHKDAIAAFEKASRDSDDQEIEDWAEGSLRGMRANLDRSIECQKKCDNM